MIKIILISCLLVIIITSTFVKLVDAEFRDNMLLINHGFVIPKILSEVRSRRWIDLDSQVLVSINRWLLKAHPNNKLLVSPQMSLHWITSNNLTNRELVPGDDCSILHGHVHDVENSRVIMTICGGNFYVFFQFDNRSFTVNPIANGSHVLEESRLHNSRLENRIYSRKKKRELMGIDRKRYYNLTGDTFDLGVDDKSKNVVATLGSDNNEGQEYFLGHKWINTKLQSAEATQMNDMAPSREPAWLELAIAVDYSVIDFHGKRVQQYVLALLNIVSSIYRDPTLEANLTLVVMRMIFYVEKKDGMVRQGNARKSLENANRWNHNFLSSATKPHDIAVWLTRLDIGGPSGYAPVSGVCDPARSCALNRDEGLTSAFIIAHELAHILGLTHDGDLTADNSCGREASMGSVMAPMVAATFHQFHWSSCSKKEYRHQIKQWSCLNNYPDTNNVTYLREVLHNTFTMDEQCRMEFGDGYQLCRSSDSPGLCSYLWCSHKHTPKVCKTKKGPPIEGTTCGKNKWCVNGHCERISRTMSSGGAVENDSKEGNWGEWSSWSRCSTTCGIGVQIRSRLCGNPLLSNDGKNCQGGSDDFMICERMKCSSSFDPRREQCDQLSNIIFDGRSGKHRRTWVPHIIDDENHICRLTCRNAETARVHISNDFVIDGTPCSYNSSDICIQGKCHRMGCDNILNSAKRSDDCGICDGDNSTCIIMSNKFQRNIRRANTRIAAVPAASHNIRIEVDMFHLSSANGVTKFIIRDRRNKKYTLKTSGVDDKFSTVVVEGTEFKIWRETNQYTIVGRGPTLNGVIISLRMMDNERKSAIISINARYVANHAKKFSYSWSLGGWSPCTLTCGGGVKRQTIACKNDQIGRLEDWKRCMHIPKPVQGIKQCNTFSCDFKWIMGKWERCTKTCGSRGVQQREIYCVHSSFPSNEVTSHNINTVHRTMLPPNICQRYQAPQIQRECNRFPCPGEWIFTEWSTCSESCGRGVQSRMARCVSFIGERSSNCGGDITPHELRPCKNHNQGQIHSECERVCHGDNSPYCIVPNLNRYCPIVEFRKLCCRTCTEIGL